MRTAGETLRDWLQSRLSADKRDWLDGQLERLGDGRDRDLVVTLGLIPRKLGKADLALGPNELAEAEAVRPGWDPRDWTVDSAARVLALLSLPPDEDAFVATFSAIAPSADAAEAIALFSGLPLYPARARLEAQAAEALRGNIRAVFEAVAHRNPYPREQFDQDRWNQMVLKALFIGSTLCPIQGLDDRANAELARILCDYAHERWAAGRPITPELWRCVGPFARGDMIDDLKRVAASADPREREAAALALVACGRPEADDILKTLEDEARRARVGTLQWDDVVRELHDEEVA